MRKLIFFCLFMVGMMSAQAKTLVLSDQTPLNPANRINNFIQ